MRRRNVLGAIATVSVSTVFLKGSESLAQSADVEAIKVANQTFYAALSARDLKAMEAVWANQTLRRQHRSAQQVDCRRLRGRRRKILGRYI